MMLNQDLCEETRKQLKGKQAKTRFAPSPTGYLHLGHVASAIYVWGLAQCLEAEVVLRIEDHDQSRFRPEYATALIDDLTWLGFIPAMTFEALAVEHHVQSSCENFYKQALSTIDPQKLFYCRCSRKNILAASPQQDPLLEKPYSGTCETLHLDPEQHTCALRMKLSDQNYLFEDVCLGAQCQNPFKQQRACILKDKHGQWSYHFAVVVDDIRDGINLVIRGEDILNSTGRQLDIYQALGENNQPVYLHHPLIKDQQGQKLSKRFLSEGIIESRRRGSTPERVLGEAAYAVGLQKNPLPISVADLPQLFWAR